VSISSFLKILRVIGFGAVALWAVCGASAQQVEQGMIADPVVAARLANEAFTSGNWDEAVRILDQLISMMPETSPDLEGVYLMKAGALFNKGAYAAAEAVYNTFLEKFPSSSNVANAKMTLGQTLALQKKWDEAAKLFKELESNFDLREEAMQYGAQVALMSGKGSEAVEALLNVMNNGPRTPDTMDVALALVKLYTDIGELQKATEGLQFLRENQRMISNLPELNRLALALGDKYRDQKDWRGALQSYRLVRPKEELIAEQKLRTEQMERMAANLERNQVSPVDKIRLARLKARLKSVNELLEAVEKSSDYDAALYIRRGRAYSDQGRLWESIILYNEIIEHFPESDEAKIALYSLSAAYRELNRPKEARELAQRFVEKYPTDPLSPQLMIVAGYSALDMRDFESAREYFRQGIEKFKDSDLRQDFYISLSNAYFTQYKFPDAREVCQAYLGEYGTGAKYREEALFQIACSYFYSDKALDSISYFSDYIKEYPQGNYVDDAKYRIIVLDFAQQEFDKVVEAGTKWMQDYPHSTLMADMSNIMGDTYMAQGEVAQAVEAYRKAISTSTHIDTTAYALDKATRAYQQLGKFDEVEKMHENYIKFNPASPLVPNSIYWISRMRVRQGNVEDAKKILADSVRENINDPNQQAVEKLIFQLAQLVTRRPRGEPGQERLALPPLPELNRQIEELLGSSQVTTPLARARIFLARAELAMLTKNTDEQRRVYNLIGEDLKPEDLSPGILARVGDNYLAQGQPEKAKPFFEQIVKKFSRSEFADFGFVGLGEIAYQKGEYQQAFDYFDRAIKETETLYKRGSAFLGKARALYQLADTDAKLTEAQELFQTVVGERAWRGEPTAMGMYYLGLIDEKRGKFADAHNTFQRVYVAYQKFPEWMAKAYLQSGKMLEKLERYNDAMATYREMLRNPKVADRKEELKQARQLLNALEKKYPNGAPETKEDPLPQPEGATPAA